MIKTVTVRLAKPVRDGNRIPRRIISQLFNQPSFSIYNSLQSSGIIVIIASLPIQWINYRNQPVNSVVLEPCCVPYRIDFGNEPVRLVIVVLNSM